MDYVPNELGSFNVYIRESTKPDDRYPAQAFRFPFARYAGDQFRTYSSEHSIYHNLTFPFHSVGRSIFHFHAVVVNVC